MSTSDKTVTAGLLERLCRTVMRPIIGIFIRAGLPFGTFSDICRSAYVEVSRSEFGIQGRPTNISRIALLTGLSRKQVKRELDALAMAVDPTDASADGVRPASRMLLGWYSDPRFLDAEGKPRPLLVDGGEGSFTQLFEIYSGKVVPMTALLKELRQVGAIELLTDGRLRVLTRSFVPQQSDPAALQRICMALRDLGTTAGYNIYRDEGRPARFERFATNQLIPSEMVGEFRLFLDREGQAFLEKADDWLARHEKRDEDDNDDLVRIGVGVYQITPGLDDDDE